VSGAGGDGPASGATVVVAVGRAAGVLLREQWLDASARKACSSTAQLGGRTARCRFIVSAPLCPAAPQSVGGVKAGMIEFCHTVRPAGEPSAFPSH
jgi:hypothetical protein